jgi:hypothetical protein
LRLAPAVVALLLATAAHAQPQDRADDSDTWRATPPSERREPWPLRPDPRPGLEGSGCLQGAHYMFRIGNIMLRLGPGIRWSADPMERRPATWTSDLPTPEGLRAGRAFFALGLLSDITIDERSARAAAGGEDDWLRRLTIRRRTPLGNEEFRAPLPHRPDLDGGSPTYRLPRTGEGAEALGPLLVECRGVRWPDPIPPPRIPYAQTCHVTFDAPRAGVRVIYRFPREVYDEPDWQALDERVREWIAARTVTEAPP